MVQEYVQYDSHVKKEAKDKILEEKVAVLRNLSKEGCLNHFDKELRQSIENIDHLKFSVLAVSDTASGKSMLLNALLAKRLLFSKKGACTAAVTEILNHDNNCFHATAYDENGAAIRDIQNPTYERMMELNGNDHVQKITMEGKIPFWQGKNTALTLIDTPNTGHVKHRDYHKMIDRAIGGDADHLILYVLDGTQMRGDMPVLEYLASIMKTGGKRVCSPVLFVINKMDLFEPREDDIHKAVLSVKKYLLSYGIENPQIIPCSAFLALGVRTYYKHKKADDLTRAQKRRLRWMVRETWNKVLKYKDMHLEQYAMLQADSQKQMEENLGAAKMREDKKTQALIHSGICSVESAIAEHVNCYKQRKQKELVKAFDDYNRKFINANPCRMLVTATMSAGKSTFINALTGKNICLSQNMACTDKIQPIISKLIDTELNLGYEHALTAGLSNQLKKEAKAVYFDGILGAQRLAVYDSPGVNYSGAAEHKKITDKIIRTGNYQLMIYLMNATQLGTNDDEAHLDYVKKCIGKRAILFVINKVDFFNEEEEDIAAAVQKQTAYLKSKGFHNPLVCPVSAKAAFLAKKSQKGQLSRLERRELHCMEDKFAQMKLTDYYQNYYSDIIIDDSEDEDIQLLKNCGISYIETIIKVLCKGGCVNGTSIC